MKRIVPVVLFGLLVASVASCQQSSAGDIWRWIPFDASVAAKDAAIARNAQYVSIKIEAAHVSYKSGFLENIKQIVVSSSVSFDLGNQKVQALNVNRTWQKSGKSDDNIPVNDLLAVLSPASPNSVSIKMSFNGIGEDRFKGVFDALSSTDVKTALSLSPAVIAQSSLATSIAQKFLASPYTSSNPKDVLSMSQGFVIYPDRDADRVDSLRQGYIVVISGSENKSADLNKLISLGADALRFDTGSHLLQVKQADGSWQQFTGNSYVVLSVTVDAIRGIDENSAWFKKFSEADRTTENLLTGDTAEKVKKNALGLWQEGSTLLSADSNYIETERKSIRLKLLATIQDDLKKNGAAPAEADLSGSVPGIPSNLTEIAKQYDAQVQGANLAGQVTVHVRDKTGKAVAGAQVVLQDAITGKGLNSTTDSAGNAQLGRVNPGTYTVHTAVPGFSVSESREITVQPRLAMQLDVPVKSD
jgi:hypothetical protein